MADYANSKQTKFIKKKYKKKKYYIRGWIEYSYTETADKKSITFDAGFETKKRKCDMKKIKMEVSDSLGAKLVEEKKWKGKKKDTHKITYISGGTIEWERKNTEQTVQLEIYGTFGKTRFSGKKVKETIEVTIPALASPSASLTANRDETDTSTRCNLVLAIKTGGSVSSSSTINQPILKRNGETHSITWYTKPYGASNRQAVSFPTTLLGNAITYYAEDTVTGLESYSYEVTGSIVRGGTTYEYTNKSAIEYYVEPAWTPITEHTVNGEPAIRITGYALPDIDYMGNAQVTIYARDFERNVYTILPNEDGWDIKIINDNTYDIAIELKEQYVSSIQLDNGEYQAVARIFLVYKTFQEAAIQDKVAIFNTNRNANFSTGLANNIFIGGCKLPDYSSRVWYSAVNNPLYMPDTNYIEVGSNDTRVMGLTKVGDYLGVIKQSKSIDTSVFLVYPTSFEDETTFATKPCVAGVGALGEYCFNTLGDETLFLSPRGVVAIEPYEDEQSRIKDRSYFVNGRLLDEPDLDKAYSFVWNGFYLLAVNGNVYVLDGNQKNSWGNTKTNLVYEAYFLEDVPAKVMFSYDGELWFADDKGNLCRFKGRNDENAYTDGTVVSDPTVEGEPVRAYWSTISDDDNALQYLKSTTKKGCLVSLLPEEGTAARVYLKKDEGKPNSDEDHATWELVKESDPIPAGTVLPPSVFIKKKVKKYTRLQFLIEDKTDRPFGVNKIIKSYTVGNYAKK